MLRLLGRFTTCLTETTTALRMLIAQLSISCLENAKKIENFDFVPS